MSKNLIGVVSSTKNDKTITVSVEYKKTHPIYKKQFTITKKFLAHDAENQAQLGDKVMIVETRPLSARKRHVLAKILNHSELKTQVDKVQTTIESGDLTWFNKKLD